MFKKLTKQIYKRSTQSKKEKWNESSLLDFITYANFKGQEFKDENLKKLVQGKTVKVSRYEYKMV